MPLAARLCRVFARTSPTVTDGDAGSGLIFPTLGGKPGADAGPVRVSEQESKVLLCQLLEEKRFFYSVETPTKNKFAFAPPPLDPLRVPRQLSARTDVTIHSDRRDAKDRLLAVELKAGLAPTASFQKDFEKLIRERVPGLWFHTLSRGGQRRLASLADNMARAWSGVTSIAEGHGHRITFALCILSPAQLFTAEVRLGIDDAEALLRQVKDLEKNGAASGWTAHDASS